MNIERVRNFLAGQSPEVYERREKDLQVTALTLAGVALFFFAVSCFCHGTGMLPPTMLQGLGLIAALMGYFMNQLAFFVAICGLVAFAISTVCFCQKKLATSKTLQSI